MRKNLFLSMVLSIFTLFVLGLNAQTQFDNPGFEDWEEIGFGPDIIEPVNWSSIKSTDDANMNNLAPLVWGRSTDAHTGNYSLYLYALSIFGFVAPGTITNGRVHAELNPDSGYTYTDPEHEEWHTRLIAKPDSITGWYKANPMPDDFAKVKLVIHRGFVAVSESEDTTGFIGSANLFLSGEVVNYWTRFSAPINYYLDEDPEFALITISCSKGVDAIEGSELWIDDLELIYNNGTGIVEENPENLNLFTSGNQLHVFVRNGNKKSYTLRIYDVNGKLHLQNPGLTDQKNTHNYQLPSGIYIVSVSYEGKVLTKKIVL